MVYANHSLHIKNLKKWLGLINADNAYYAYSTLTRFRKLSREYASKLMGLYIIFRETEIVGFSHYSVAITLCK